MSNKKNQYIPASFSGVNTGAGFVSFYDSIFPEDKLSGFYIIKGGSGTGKSTFMKRLGEHAMGMGYLCEHYLCGSDENSLDGIVIKGKKSGVVGVIDGTPPHPKEFLSPGAAGDILNFGMFWDSGKLRQRRKEIDALVKEKSGCFDTAYRYLGAADKINRHIFALSNDIYLKDKGYAAAARLVSAIGVKGSHSYRQLTGFTMNGTVRLTPTGKNIREYIVSGNEEIGGMFLADVEKYIELNNISAQISRSPLNLQNTDGIFFPETGVWLHIGGKSDNEAEKIINTSRFIDREYAAACRQKMRFGKKCRASLLEGAAEALASAKDRHFTLEEIYKEYMDFDALSHQSELWYSEILSRLD